MSYTLENFYRYIAPDVNECPMPVVEDAVRDAIITFCQRSSYWRLWLEDQISVSQDDESVELELPKNTRLVDVLGIQKVNSDGDYGDYLDKGSYVYAGFESTPQILFNVPADEDFDARVRVALRPDIDTDTVQDWVYEDFRDVICHGAKYRLLSMRSKAWYAQAESEFYRRHFKDAINRAAALVALESVNTLAPKQAGYI